MAEGPFRVMLRMQIKPGMQEEFERVWLEVGDSVTSHPANLGQWLSRDEEEGVYWIVSDWVDEPRFREFEHSDRILPVRFLTIDQPPDGLLHEVADDRAGQRLEHG
ncbi:antibiotic biosynthesis monooxygenase, partial [Micromonospora sp. ATA51]|uniref:antibiotic biosynthesis monooxygenase family protein n=1 Tax=Micromonospora sp. ATA51 TaxID=2806098 RepID=UPI001A374213